MFFTVSYLCNFFFFSYNICFLLKKGRVEWYFSFAFIVEKLSKWWPLSVFVIPDIISESVKLFLKIWSMHIALVQEALVSRLIMGARPFWKERLKIVLRLSWLSNPTSFCWFHQEEKENYLMVKSFTLFLWSRFWADWSLHRGLCKYLK